MSEDPPPRKESKLFTHFAKSFWFLVDLPEIVACVAIILTVFAVLATGVHYVVKTSSGVDMSWMLAVSLTSGVIGAMIYFKKCVERFLK